MKKEEEGDELKKKEEEGDELKKKVEGIDQLNRREVKKKEEFNSIDQRTQMTDFAVFRRPK